MHQAIATTAASAYSNNGSSFAMASNSTGQTNISSDINTGMSRF